MNKTEVKKIIEQLKSYYARLAKINREHRGVNLRGTNCTISEVIKEIGFWRKYYAKAQ